LELDNDQKKEIKFNLSMSFIIFSTIPACIFAFFIIIFVNFTAV